MLYPACISCGSFAVPLWVRRSCCYFSKTTVNNTPIPPTVDGYTTDSQSQHIGRHITLYSVDMYTILGWYVSWLSVDTSAESVDQQRSLLHMIKIAWACRASAIWGLWKIYKCFNLFQTTQEKSCDYLLKIYMKKFWRWLSRRNAHISCNQGKNCAIQGTHLI